MAKPFKATKIKHIEAPQVFRRDTVVWVWRSKVRSDVSATVYGEAVSGKWIALSDINGKLSTLGTFDTKQEALNAANSFVKRYEI